MICIGSFRDIEGRIIRYQRTVVIKSEGSVAAELEKFAELKDKGVICLEDFGNTVSSSIPIALANNVDFKDKNKNKIKNKILLVGFGVGLSWGITLLTV